MSAELINFREARERVWARRAPPGTHMGEHACPVCDGVTTVTVSEDDVQAGHYPTITCPYCYAKEPLTEPTDDPTWAQ